MTGVEDGVLSAVDIRARVDAMAPSVHGDGRINTQHVAMEQTLRSRHGHPGFIDELDGPGRFRPGPSLADVAGAAVATAEKHAQAMAAMERALTLTADVMDALRPVLWRLHWRAERHRVRVVTRRKQRRRVR